MLLIIKPDQITATNFTDALPALLLEGKVVLHL